MLNTGPAKKVTVYVIEGQTYHGTACYAAILDYLFFRGISDATVTRGLAGFGTDHKMHTSRLVDLSDQMPIKIEFIENADRVQEVLPKLAEIASQGLIEVHDTTVIRPAPPGEKSHGRCAGRQAAVKSQNDAHPDRRKRQVERQAPPYSAGAGAAGQ